MTLILTVLFNPDLGLAASIAFSMLTVIFRTQLWARLHKHTHIHTLIHTQREKVRESERERLTETTTQKTLTFSVSLFRNTLVCLCSSKGKANKVSQPFRNEQEKQTDINNIDKLYRLTNYTNALCVVCVNVSGLSTPCSDRFLEQIFTDP